MPITECDRHARVLQDRHRRQRHGQRAAQGELPVRRLPGLAGDRRITRSVAELLRMACILVLA